ncbi:MAG: hypothetical protein HY778_08085 [Betaproteobacteria bacterium]|nr:hypothetical protein [Betaproteobacteria bacterium]
MNPHFLAMALSLAITLPALADTLACPDPATAVQVATCPSEEELKHTFIGYCSDNARMYARDTDTCTRYENYRRLKNVALWESQDGAFQAYVSCDLPAGALKTLKPAAIAVTRQGKLTRLACSYPEGIVFTHRSRAQCKVQGDGNCAADPAACKADCD